MTWVKCMIHRFPPHHLTTASHTLDNTSNVSTRELLISLYLFFRLKMDINWKLIGLSFQGFRHWTLAHESLVSALNKINVWWWQALTFQMTHCEAQQLASFLLPSLNIEADLLSSKGKQLLHNDTDSVSTRLLQSNTSPKLRNISILSVESFIVSTSGSICSRVPWYNVMLCRMSWWWINNFVHAEVSTSQGSVNRKCNHC